MNKKTVIFALVMALAILGLTATAVIAARGSARGSFDGSLVAWGCDGDLDCDGVADGPDNCDDVANADQADKDRDGVGNVCDANPNNANVSRFDGANMPIRMEHPPEIPEDVKSALALKATLTGCGDCAGNTVAGSWTGELEFVCVNHGDNTVINSAFSPGEGESGPITIEPADVSSNGKVILRLVAPANLANLEVGDICPNDKNWAAELTGVSINTLTVEHRDGSGNLLQTFAFDVEEDCESTGDDSFQCSAR
jgi:hypothetical protein